MPDLFFEMNYAKLYESIEHGRSEVFEFNSELGKIRHVFLKRKISGAAEDEPYYDLTTPYGYGGPLIIEARGNKKELVQQFQDAFKIYCEKHNIVSEFIRFHPLFSNAEDFKEQYEIELRRSTTGTTLSAHEDPVQAEFSKSARRNVRKSLEAGVTYSITRNPPDLTAFKDIYYHTMKRNNADTIYFFDDVYFKSCQELLGEHLLLIEVQFEGKPIGMALSFVYNKVIHTHLSGTLEDFHHLSPAYVLQYALVQWGKENGYKLIHDGGGRTSEPDDNLYLFKKQFGKNTEFQYFVGHKIWNEDVYNRLRSS